MIATYAAHARETHATFTTRGICNFLQGATVHGISDCIWIVPNTVDPGE